MKRNFIRMVLATFMISLTATAILHGQGGEVKKLPQPPREILRVEPGSRGIMAFAYSPDGKWFACEAGDAAVLVYDTRTGKLVRKLEKDGSTKRAEVIVFSPAGDKLLTGHVNEGIRLWNLKTGTLLDLQAIPGQKPP